MLKNWSNCSFLNWCHMKITSLIQRAIWKFYVDNGSQRKRKKKEDVNKLTEETWNLSYQPIIINFMLIGLVSLRFHCSPLCGFPNWGISTGLWPLIGYCLIINIHFSRGICLIELKKLMSQQEQQFPSDLGALKRQTRPPKQNWIIIWKQHLAFPSHL